MTDTNAKTTGNASVTPAERKAIDKPAKEPRSKAGWLALLFTLALVGWMGSGYYQDEVAPSAEAPATTPRQNSEPFAVEAFVSKAQAVTQFVGAEGQAQPDRSTPVRAKVGGTIEEIAARKGQFLQEGALIARIALADRAAQVAQAEAELSRRRGEFERVNGLAQRGYATRAEVEEAQAALAVAEAGLATINQASGDTEIRAPITGVLENFDLDIGEYVSATDEIGTQIDTDPLSIDIQVTQQNIGRLERGQRARVTFITGEVREGEVTYVATNANPATRTFPVEITVPNPERDIPAGISAEVQIPVGETPAHFLSAAILSLGQDGELGVKAVEADDTVGFYPAELVRAETDGIWVSGLPDTLRLISVGQGFVSQGEKVRPIAPKNGETPEAPAEGAPEIALPGEVAASSSGAEASGLMSPTASLRPAGATAAASETDTAASGPAAGGDLVTVLQSAAQSGRLNEAAAADTELVRLAQQALARLGYDAGPVDGVMGTTTRSAIRAFQEDTGIETTGTMTEAFARALVAAIGADGN